jgi:hypothetical protein
MAEVGSHFMVRVSRGLREREGSSDRWETWCEWELYGQCPIAKRIRVSDFRRPFVPKSERTSTLFHVLKAGLKSKLKSTSCSCL